MRSRSGESPSVGFLFVLFVSLKALIDWNWSNRNWWYWLLWIIFFLPEFAGVFSIMRMCRLETYVMGCKLRLAGFLEPRIG